MVNRKICWPETEYEGLESGIKDLVKALHSLNIITEMSCEGHIRTAWYYVGILPWPWVIIVVTPQELVDLVVKIDLWNKTNPTKKWILSTERIHKSYTPEFINTVMKRDFPGTSILALTPENENDDLSQSVLEQFQSQVPKLARFLTKPS